MKIFYFARLVDQLNVAEEQLELPPHVTTVEALLTRLRDRGAQWQTALAPGEINVTVNKQFAAPDVRIFQTDEIAIIPLRA
jgi:sulfur-carrier protein